MESLLTMGGNANRYKSLYDRRDEVMEITEAQWNELCEKVNGFQTKIEELTNANTALKTENEGFEAKLQEWQTKLNDQQTTIDTLAAAKGQAGAGQPKEKPKTSGHKSVRFDPVQDKYIFD